MIMEAVILCLGIFFIVKLLGSLGEKDSNTESLRQNAINEFMKKENIVPKVKKIIENKKEIFDFTITDAEDIALQKINFEKNEFLNGVDDAVEIVSELLSKKEFENLKLILGDDLFKQFQERAAELNEQERNLQSQVIQVVDKKIESLKIEKTFVYMYVMIESKQINYIEDKEKKVVLGSKKDISTIKEKWTFKRDFSIKESFWVIDNVI
jgi:predicted lipid-binding transport protein (Tim44 family)